MKGPGQDAGPSQLPACSGSEAGARHAGLLGGSGSRGVVGACWQEVSAVRSVSVCPAVCKTWEMPVSPQPPPDDKGTPSSTRRRTPAQEETARLEEVARPTGRWPWQGTREQRAGSRTDSAFPPPPATGHRVKGEWEFLLPVPSLPVTVPWTHPEISTRSRSHVTGGGFLGARGGDVELELTS